MRDWANGGEHPRGNGARHRCVGYNPTVDSNSNLGQQLDIGPDNRPFTLPEVRVNVAELIEQFAGDPGVELLGFIAAMLANTRCVCAADDNGNADVIPLVTRAHDDQR